jgi:hypothetical protein
MQRRRVIGVVTSLALAAGITSAWAALPGEICQLGKNKAAGKFATCRHKAYAKYALTGDATKRDADLARCATRFGARWQSLEAKALEQDGACLSMDDRQTVQEFIESFTGNVAGGLAGGPLLGGPQGLRLRTGITACWNGSGASIPCAGTGQDGELQFGLSPFYLDFGDGTIIDTRTGLTWEKFSDDGSIHDRDNRYDWRDGFAKAEALNAMRFAGYTDWRVPNVNELNSLVDYSVPSPGPSIRLAFNLYCPAGCTVYSCSCSAPGLGLHWTSTSTDPGWRALGLRFDDGVLFTAPATPPAPMHVRAVRGGL